MVHDHHELGDVVDESGEGRPQAGPRVRHVERQAGSGEFAERPADGRQVEDIRSRIVVDELPDPDDRCALVLPGADPRGRRGGVLERNPRDDPGRPGVPRGHVEQGSRVAIGVGRLHQDRAIHPRRGEYPRGVVRAEAGMGRAERGRVPGVVARREIPEVQVRIDDHGIRPRSRRSAQSPSGMSVTKRSTF
ncbi:hypothetical protein GCM10025867_00620 [Frondihabitans sucicola]|uniref:Uncharacterized protein n=1 Tax=Frondihabitans sucicola TaxID=1268041 RepID=A0ABM8GHH0_9MICO|nr:hypothetical protein [Frondihabitans sucicola]BDZ47821.1 hypothetical protein GCM10025867_00620 [Frondihabitans sucicola]